MRINFSDWLNKTSMTSFRAFVITILATIVILFFSVIAGMMLLDDTASKAFVASIKVVQSDTTKAVLDAAAGMRAAAQTTETSRYNYGMQLVTAILTLIGVAIGANTIQHHSDRTTSREREEAKERGRVSGTAAAAAAAALVAETAKKVANGEVPSVEAGPKVVVENAQQVAAVIATEPEAPSIEDEPKWADGRKDEGIL